MEVLAQLEGLDDGVRQQALDEADDNQLTALHLAAYTDHQVAAAMLLAAGAPLETKVVGMGITALHWAAAQGSSMVLAQLSLTHHDSKMKGGGETSSKLWTGGAGARKRAMGGSKLQPKKKRRPGPLMAGTYSKSSTRDFLFPFFSFPFLSFFLLFFFAFCFSPPFSHPDA